VSHPPARDRLGGAARTTPASQCLWENTDDYKDARFAGLAGDRSLDEVNSLALPSVRLCYSLARPRATRRRRVNAIRPSGMNMVVGTRHEA
jgi:hypothetical protein